MELEALIQRIHEEVDPLLAQGIEPRQAYALALGAVAQRIVETDRLDPFDARILGELERAMKANGGRPVSTTYLAVRLGIESRFTMWWHMSRLERRGLVKRPLGANSKSGWSVVA
jgi:hypothetical protein